MAFPPFFGNDYTTPESFAQGEKVLLNCQSIKFQFVGFTKPSRDRIAPPGRGGAWDALVVAAAVVIARSAIAVIAAAAPVTAAVAQQNQDDDPPQAVAAEAHTVVTAHRNYLRKFRFELCRSIHAIPSGKKCADITVPAGRLPARSWQRFFRPSP